MLKQPTFSFPSGSVAFSLESNDPIPAIDGSYIVVVEQPYWPNIESNTKPEVWHSNVHVYVERGRVDPESFAFAVRQCLDKCGYHGIFVEDINVHISSFGVCLEAVVGS